MLELFWTVETMGFPFRWTKRPVYYLQVRVGRFNVPLGMVEEGVFQNEWTARIGNTVLKSGTANTVAEAAQALCDFLHVQVEGEIP